MYSIPIVGPTNAREKRWPASAPLPLYCFQMYKPSTDTLHSFTDGTLQYAMTSMFVPAPVISLAVKPKQSSMFANFSKALQRFCKVGVLT